MDSKNNWCYRCNAIIPKNYTPPPPSYPPINEQGVAGRNAIYMGDNGETICSFVSILLLIVSIITGIIGFAANSASSSRYSYEGPLVTSSFLLSFAVSGLFSSALFYGVARAIALLKFIAKKADSQSGRLG
jgi:hypothetical protein